MIRRQTRFLFFLFALISIFTAASSGLKAETIAEVAFSADGSMFLAGKLGKISVWETSTGKLLQKFPNDSDESPRYAAFAPDGRTILLVSEKNQLIWRDIATGDAVKKIEFAASSPFALSPDGKILTNLTISAKDEEIINLYDSRNGTLLREIFLPRKFITCLSIFPGGKKLLAVGSVETLVISTVNGRIVKKFHNPIACLSCAVSPDENSALLNTSFGAAEKDAARILNLQNKKYRGLDEKFAALIRRSNVVGYSPIDPTTAFAAGGSSISRKGLLLIWNIKSGQIKQTITGEREIVAAAFSPDGENILSFDSAGNLILNDVESGMIIRQYNTQPEKEVTAAN